MLLTEDTRRAFYHERFNIEVPEELLHGVFPFLPALQASVDVVTSREKVVSPQNVLLHITQLARALIQDTIFIQATRSPPPPCPVLHTLLPSALFMQQVHMFQRARHVGISELNRPMPPAQETARAVVRCLGLPVQGGPPLRDTLAAHTPPASTAHPTDHVRGDSASVATPEVPPCSAGSPQLPLGFPVGTRFFTSFQSLKDVSIFNCSYFLALQMMSTSLNLLVLIK